MSASLVVLLPVILFGIVSLLCFVGCVLNTHGLGPTFTQYSTSTVLGNPAVVAYWPLNEANDTLPATDLTANPDNGQYIDPSTLPAIYPWPDFSIPDSPLPDIESAAAGVGTMAAAGFGTIAFAQPGIVTGDFGTGESDSDSSAASTCLVVNGCYVNVPLASKINPTSFTLEAWVRVDWDKSAPHAWRAVLDARDSNPSTGFAILAKADDNAPGVYHWSVIIGNGAGFTVVESADPPITLKDPSSAAGTTYYLAVTYDGPSQTLILYVDGLQSGPAVTPTVYVPNTTKPLWIGAGAPFVAMRPQPAGVVASPLFPFVGALQDVAIYNAALEPGVILTHLHNGSGFNP
jgi:concanavalin A-like lectin/glucanase superfamily protein